MALLNIWLLHCFVTRTTIFLKTFYMIKFGLENHKIKTGKDIDAEYMPFIKKTYDIYFHLRK